MDGLYPFEAHSAQGAANQTAGGPEGRREERGDMKP